MKLNKRNMFFLGALAGAVVSFPSRRKFDKIRIGNDNMKTLGMIGGTSWHSTIEYYRLLNSTVNERTDGLISPPLLLYSINVDLMRRADWDEINRAYLDISQTLEGDGAEAIVLCANTPHKVYSYVQPKISIPIIHIADATANEAKRLGLNSLGLLGTKPVMSGGFIPERILEVSGINTILPEAERQEDIHNAVVSKLVKGIFDEETRAFFKNEMDLLKDRGADGIILGCTELPMLFDREDYELPMLDTTKLHAEMAVDFILSEIESSTS